MLVMVGLAMSPRKRKTPTPAQWQMPGLDFFNDPKPTFVGLKLSLVSVYGKTIYWSRMDRAERLFLQSSEVAAQKLRDAP